jgi:hypothetical protein
MGAEITFQIGSFEETAGWGENCVTPSLSELTIFIQRRDFTIALEMGQALRLAESITLGFASQFHAGVVYSLLAPPMAVVLCVLISSRQRHASCEVKERER